ncbi:MAG: hypothetical protein GC146_07270 [Limimaricola sp.]|uniref:bestrophin-like domain n=1 Tax=Limimaricola sp. TaxID=2211665 RepID=UPI001D5FA1F5|nr:hypothetical protein [Limimaricola sp.]MBI1417004.1 hypothetical protein [Limimaricola sp.]
MVRDILISGGFVLGTVLLTWVIYFGMRLFVRDRVAPDTKDLAGSVIFRVAALHGLILGLVFAQELLDYNEIRADLVREATAVADIYNDMNRYGGDEVAAVQLALSDYVRQVVTVEWDRLGQQGRLSAEGWVFRETFYQSILNLSPNSPRQTDLRSHMVQNSQLIATLRQQRENTAIYHMGALFWIAALGGLVFVALPYFTFTPTPLHVALLSIYGAFSGLIMLMIYAFSNPFSPPGALAPTAFERLMETEIGVGPRRSPDL